jgi:hypothetical protein
MEQQLITRAELAAVVTRADGSAREIALGGQKKHWEREWERWRQWLPHLSLAAFAVWAAANPELAGQDPGALFGLVTTAGANYLAADFLSGSSARINAFNWQDCGTGTTAMAIGDTALQTPSGLSRVSGTQSTPTSGQYRTVATFNFTSTLAITEWGLFSASTSGTLWDRRTFSAINVANGDSIQFTYTLTVPAGGS